MNRRFKAPDLPNYEQAIRVAAHRIERHQPFWSMNEVLTEIRNRFALSSAAFEHRFLEAFQHLVEWEHLTHHIHWDQSVVYSLGFQYDERGQVIPKR